MRKIITIVGARPQFIKLSVVSRILRDCFEEIIVHTGQHYDYNMSELFFRQLDIPKPDYNLGIAGGMHGKMTAQMLEKIEEILVKEQPDGVLVYGDTNSTMAGSLAAVKLHIPVFHVEAGTRLGTLGNPEEVNRIVADHVSTKLFACTNSAMEFLQGEGLSEKSVLVGDPMYDTFLYYKNLIGNKIPEQLKLISGEQQRLPDRFYYMTCHRQENTADDQVLQEILAAMESLNEKTIYPVHPRNRMMVEQLQTVHSYHNIIFCQPVGYLMSNYLVNHAEKIVTDSGGLQREAYFAKKPCVTVFDYVAWPETMIGSCNQLAEPKKEDILAKLSKKISFNQYDLQFGNGHAGDKIVRILEQFFK